MKPRGRPITNPARHKDRLRQRAWYERKKQTKVTP